MCGWKKRENSGKFLEFVSFVRLCDGVCARVVWVVWMVSKGYTTSTRKQLIFCIQTVQRGYTLDIRTNMDKLRTSLRTQLVPMLSLQKVDISGENPCPRDHLDRRRYA